MPNRSSHTSVRIFVVLVGVMCAFNGHAQDLEPRTYANTPVGMNFLIVGYSYTDGGLSLDPAIPIQGANAQLDIGLLGYVHSFGISGKSAKFTLIQPYAGMDVNGFVEGEYRERNVSGFADTVLALSVNFSGAPALTLPEFASYRQDTIIGATLKVVAPSGQYDETKLFNLSSNRWSIKPEIGISQALGSWVLEGAAAVAIYTDNNEFFGGQKLEQDPIYSVQGHVIYNFISSGLWAALDATYYTGGATTVAGDKKDNKLDNWRTGCTLAIPVDKFNSIKLAASTGVSTRTGTDFDVYLVAWQYRWGGGLH